MSHLPLLEAGIRGKTEARFIIESLIFEAEGMDISTRLKDDVDLLRDVQAEMRLLGPHFGWSAL